MERIPDYTRGTLRDVLTGCLAALGLPGSADPLGLSLELAGVARVAVLLIDGMGWHQLPAMAPYAPGLATLPSRRITCGFPSTTPTSLVSLATGAVPGAHGVLAFTTIVPGSDRVLNHATWMADPIPARWQPVPTLFTAAAAHGITVSVVNRPEYIGSGLTEVTSRGASYRPVTTVEQLAGGLIAELTGSAGPALSYGYYPGLDKAGHEFGLTSAQWRLAASDVDRIAGRVIEALPADAALVITADHGQLDVPADRRIDVDADPRLGTGVRVLAGEPRVRYVHTQPGAQADVLAAWREAAGHAAWIGSREEAIATGWYGRFDPAFAQRLGDVVAVCRDDWVLVAKARERLQTSQLVAYHGALTAAEMDIPLLVVRGG